MARRIRRAAASAVVLSILTLLAPVPGGSAQAAGEAYVALGDSYSSGLGTGSYLDDGTDCRRSTYAYPSLVAAGASYELDFRACSGAVVADVLDLQLGALSSSTSYVTVSVGGNDAGFADVLTECALPAWASDCDAAIDTAQAVVAETLPTSLDGLYAEIAGRAPAATVVAVGYPRIFMGEDCDAMTWFSPEEQDRLNQTADQLNATIEEIAAAHGFSFADPTSAFLGHAVCDEPAWVNGLSSPVEESYHPNAAGHRDGYTPVVGPALTGGETTVDHGVLATAGDVADDLAAQQRQYAHLDRTIERRDFQAPDLNSPEVRQAAREHGIDIDRWLASQR
ncbi:SGNH/GDSL hydrolase family protein [Georgenia alba]|uniref:SGNH/GDSL hydrolase family protein n=1 Tax=Georgenia alba TaxID=2233858 RepID=A0ABW2QB56_9MICO